MLNLSFKRTELYSMKVISALCLFLFPLAVTSAAPVPYSGKVAINGLNFQGDAQFTFALRDANGAVHWRNGVDANASVTLNVDRGLYVTLLGGHTMNDFPPGLFLENSQLFLVVNFYQDDTGEWLHLLPDQRITSAPHALAAEVANLANVAKSVEPGSITRDMLSSSVRSDLNRTIVITRDMLPGDVLADLNRSIQFSDLAPDIRADLNATITRSRLAADVLADLDHSIDSGSITRDMLSADVRTDLNASLSSASVTAANIHPDLVKYFLPEISNHPAGVSILQGTGTTLSSAATGKFLTYQWQKNGVDLSGETNATLVLTDVNAANDGNYTVVVSNDWGSVTSNVSTFTVATNSPVITLVGTSSVTHEAVTSYTDSGATAVDALDGNLTASIVVAGHDFDNTAIGDHNVTFNVSDAGGNAAAEKVRTVTVVDTTAPVITLIGDSNMSHGINTAWNDPGVNASDTLDGNLSAQVAVSGTVDVNATGANVLTYNVSDAAGNIATSVSRTVNVVQPPSGPWNFTNAGVTGRTGPTQAQVNTAYAGGSLASKVTINTQGIQEWTVPATGTYSIEAFGAQGGSASGPGGLGARMNGNFDLAAGEVLKVLVGQQGSSSNGGSGGGGTFVVKSVNNLKLVIAGGGGGTGNGGGSSGSGSQKHAVVSASGVDGAQFNEVGGAGGTNGGGGGTSIVPSNSGWPGFGGAGFSGNGSGGSESFLNGGLAGTGFSNNSPGGFGGGGGGGQWGAGGGGGHSGGGNSTRHAVGGGGGSYNSGTSQNNTAAANQGHGKVTITWVEN